MSRNHQACCPGCGERMPFKQFLLLNNFSAINCTQCNTRIEIANRSSNTMMAGLSGIISGALITLSTYIGSTDFASFWGGLSVGCIFALLTIMGICRYAYSHSELNRIFQR